MILFIHGVPDTPALWTPLIAALDLKPGDYAAPALPGFGCPVPKGFDRTKDGYAHWLVGQMEAAKTPVHLVGHDWGALLVLRAASLRPNLVASWCVTNAVIDGQYRGHQTARIWATPLLGELAMAAMRNTERLKTGLISGGMPPALAEEEALRMDLTMRQSILSLYRSAAGLRFKGPWLDDLKALPARGQVFWGENDPFVDLTVAQRFAAERGYPLHVEQGAGHWACHERATAFAGVLKGFWGA